MKRILILIMLVVASGSVSAQLFKKNNKVVEAQYQAGAVPVINGKVTFEEFIPAEGMSAAEIEEKINGWVARRFVKPTVIRSVLYESEQPHTAIVKSEEYIVFKKTAFVQNTPRIYYYLTITAEDGGCRFNMSRITYWYDDQDEKGGVQMKAENWITDDMAFKKNGRLKKFEGKFRRKTIDLKEKLVKELTDELTSNR
ncbi:MAG: DUF4468 domain-containing protein [Bacteroidaceae bacterium]|nr:DUF4468 domain-containing protein [Bacteroidaceae bacterium]